MSARDLTAALGGHWHGNHGMARCPAHQDHTPSLSVSDGSDGKLLVHCHAGCSQADVWDTIRPLIGNGDHSPLPKNSVHDEPSFPDAAERSAKARAIWKQCQPIGVGTPTAIYLRHRGVDPGATCPTLRHHGALLHPDLGQHLPALIAAVSGPDHRVTAIQRTWLRLDGQGKAQCNRAKMALGPLGNGAVRLAPAGPVLGLAEGVEDALSATQLFDVPCWAALGTRFARVDIPPEVSELHLYGDNGGPGHEAAKKAAAVFREKGRRVVVRFPPAGHGDWNDALRAGMVAA